jgi:hypothetical protein
MKDILFWDGFQGLTLLYDDAGDDEGKAYYG